MERIQIKQQGEVATLQEHQQALYILLQEFDRIAQKLQTPYVLFAGTLLGAVRHKGFIPWDDDLDVIMMRKDYERFLKEAPAILNKTSFFLQAEFTEHWPMFFSKLRLNNTACLEKYHPKDMESHRGVYIDIFPCDNAYSSKLGRIIQFLCSKVIIAKGLDRRGYDNTGLLKKVFIRLCRLLPSDPFLKVVKGPQMQTDHVHSFLGGSSRYSRSNYSRWYFEEVEMCEFEQGRYPIPKQYDAILTLLYGDYMRIPSVSKRNIKIHTELVDLRKSYQEYAHYWEGAKFDGYTRSIR